MGTPNKSGGCGKFQDFFPKLVNIKCLVKGLFEANLQFTNHCNSLWDENCSVVKQIENNKDLY